MQGAPLDCGGWEPDAGGGGSAVEVEVEVEAEAEAEAEAEDATAPPPPPPSYSSRSSSFIAVGRRGGRTDGRGVGEEGCGESDENKIGSLVEKKDLTAEAVSEKRVIYKFFGEKNVFFGAIKLMRGENK